MAATESFVGIAIAARLQILRVGSAVYICLKYYLLYKSFYDICIL